MAVLVLLAFGMLILANLGVPYTLAFSPRYRDGKHGMSLLTFVEIGVLALAVIATAISPGPVPWRWYEVALGGTAILVAAYIHMFVACFVIGLIQRLIRRRK